MAVQQALDFQWVNADAAAFDHVLFAASDEKIAFLIEVTEIARVKPAVAKRRASGLGIFVVAVRRQRALTHYLAHLVNGQRIIVVIDNAQLYAPDRSPRGVR